MPNPKLVRILTAISGRCASIAQANGFYTDIGCRLMLDRREPLEDETPCCVISYGNRETVELLSRRQKCAMTVSVTGYHEIAANDDPEIVALLMLADIQRAVELEDDTLNGLLLGAQYGISFQSDVVFLPDTGEDIIGATVIYSLPHIRKSGDSEIE